MLVIFDTVDVAVVNKTSELNGPTAENPNAGY